MRSQFYGNGIKSVATAIAAIALISLTIVFGTFENGRTEEGQTQLEIRKFKLIHNDIIRDIEAIRKAKEPRAKRDLVEDIEKIIYEEIELRFMKPVDMDPSSVLNGNGAASYVVAEEASSMASNIALAYAMLGIAKCYEGFKEAGEDIFAKAKRIYPDIMDFTVSMDFRNNRPVKAWISDSQSFCEHSKTVRVTFYGKSVSQEVVEKTNSYNISLFHAESNNVYLENVGACDIIRGLNRYIKTGDVLDDRKANFFIIYLEPGKYVYKNNVYNKTEIPFKISKSRSSNIFTIETNTDGVAIAPILDVEAFKTEMRKSLVRTDYAPADDAPADDAPADDAPADDAPADDAPADDAPADDAPADDAPADDAPADDAPADDAPADEAPADDAPADDAPVDDPPADDAPTEVPDDAAETGDDAGEVVAPPTDEPVIE